MLTSISSATGDNSAKTPLTGEGNGVLKHRGAAHGRVRPLEEGVGENSADGSDHDTAKQQNATLHTPPARQLAENGDVPHGLEGDVSDGQATNAKDRSTASQPERLHHTLQRQLRGESLSEQGGAEPDGLATGSPSVVNRVGNPSLKRGEHGGMQGLEVAPSPYRGTPTVTNGAGGASQHNTERNTNTRHGTTHKTQHMTHNTQHSTEQHNSTQRNTTQHNTINTTEQKTEHNTQ